MANVIIDIASEFTGKKAFKQAETATAKLTSNVKKLAAGLGIAFGARALATYSKNAVKAFAEDEKAAKSLTLTLNNLGMAFADPVVKEFISSLEKQYGIVDDLLRPAYQKLLTTTGNYVKAQQLLTTGLDLAAMSGQDIVSVSNDLARAYAGNTRGLIKYGIGLSKTEIAAMSFEEILAKIASVSAGQATAAADSYAGALGRMQVAAANASESIGRDLLNALDTLGGGEGLPKTINLIESFSSGIGDALIGISRLIRNIIILGSGNPLESFRDLQKATREDRAADLKERAQYGGIYAELYKSQAASAALQKKSLNVAKAITKETAAQLKAKKLANAIDKANLAILQGEEIFDMDKIQVAAALTNQAELLGKATNGAQLLQIANDTARLNIKKSISDLEDAIASKDQAAIEAATKKLNEDIKIFNALSGQNTRMASIKSILESLKPKELIDQKNLDDALRKIKEMLALLAGGGGGGAGGGVFGGAGAAGLAAATSKPTVASVAAAIAGRAGTAISGMNDPRVTYGGMRPNMGGGYDAFNPEMIGMTSRGQASGATNITVNTGVGDPEAIARAVEDVIRQARSRGTLGTFTL